MIVLKLGGSLAKDKKILFGLCSEIENLSNDFSMLVVPGGGVFADLVRDYDEKFKLSPEASHKMAVLAMDQVGFMISQFFKNYVFIDDLNDLNKFKNLDKVKIFIPSGFLFELPESELEHSWDVTSDSISAYVADKINAGKLILLKDVDGIYDSDPKKNKDAKLIKKINLTEIKKVTETCVDRKFSGFLKTECAIINGKFPGRLSDVLENNDFTGTEILIN
jgi:aspartokinase-like uncharacterized kinase